MDTSEVDELLVLEEVLDLLSTFLGRSRYSSTDIFFFFGRSSSTEGTWTVNSGRFSASAVWSADEMTELGMDRIDWTGWEEATVEPVDVVTAETVEEEEEVDESGLVSVAVTGVVMLTGGATEGVETVEVGSKVFPLKIKKPGFTNPLFS